MKVGVIGYDHQKFEIVEYNAEKSKKHKCDVYEVDDLFFKDIPGHPVTHSCLVTDLKIENIIEQAWKLLIVDKYN